MDRRKTWPMYCPLDFRFDASRLYAELMGLSRRFQLLPTTQAMLDRRSEWFEVAPAKLHEDVERMASNASGDARREVVSGGVRSWRGLSLTHVPERPETSAGSSRYRARYAGAWTWRRDLPVPYARRLVRRMPLERVDTVRVMTLGRGAFGPVHCDCESDVPWERDGMASITLMVSNGGVPTRFMTSDRRVHDVDDGAFFFKDCAPHGVPPARSRRLLLRVHGLAKPEKLRDLMRLKCAIW